MAEDHWRPVAASQEGLITRSQLREAGVQRWSVAHRIETNRWQAISGTVIATTNGLLSQSQRQWAAVLHAGDGALLGDLTAAEGHGLRNWHRDELTVYVPHSGRRHRSLAGAHYVLSRRDLTQLRSRRAGVPTARLEPSILLFASTAPSERTAIGALAATVQQQLTAPASLLEWLDRLSPLPRAPLIREALREIAGGAQSVAELDVKRMCRSHGIEPPRRQRRRRDADGRLRYTDCEWTLPTGHTLVLEVDGAFHMSSESWEDDIRRQRALAATGLLVVRCTSRELRDCSQIVAGHLIQLGVPRVRQRGA